MRLYPPGLPRTYSRPPTSIPKKLNRRDGQATTELPFKLQTASADWPSGCPTATAHWLLFPRRSYCERAGGVSLVRQKFRLVDVTSPAFLKGSRTELGVANGCFSLAAAVELSDWWRASAFAWEGGAWQGNGRLAKHCTKCEIYAGWVCAAAIAPQPLQLKALNWKVM